MFGTIIGSIVGSQFDDESNPPKTKDFELLSTYCHLTPSAIVALATAKAIIDSRDVYSSLDAREIITLRQVCKNYEEVTFSSAFNRWIYASSPRPYHADTCGGALRVEAIGQIAHTVDEAKKYADLVCKITHDSPIAMQGAEAVAVACFMANTGYSRSEIRGEMEDYFYPTVGRLDEVRKTYVFNARADNVVPYALIAFYESKNFEDAIRNAASLGDYDGNLTAIAGAIAGAYYGIPEDLYLDAIAFIDSYGMDIIHKYEKKFGEPYKKKR